jgi:PAS domain-containing protein
MSETGVPGLNDGLRKSACGREMLARDWSGTAVGPIDKWPPSLSSLVMMILACPTPMFLAWGPDLNAFYNDAYLPILGQRAAGAMGRPFRELWGDLWDTIGPLVDATLAGESRRMIDLQLDLRREGVSEESWWTFTLSPVRDGDGGIAGLISLSGETTQRVLAERERMAQGRRLQGLMSKGSSIGAWDWDVVADRVTADARFARLYGLTPARAAAGAPIAEFFAGIHPDDLTRVKAEVEEAMRSGGIFTSVYRLTDEAGVVRRVIAQGRCIFDATGQCVRFPGVSFDITDQLDADSASI